MSSGIYGTSVCVSPSKRLKNHRYVTGGAVLSTGQVNWTVLVPDRMVKECSRSVLSRRPTINHEMMKKT